MGVVGLQRIKNGRGLQRTRKMGVVYNERKWEGFTTDEKNGSDLQRIKNGSSLQRTKQLGVVYNG